MPESEPRMMLFDQHLVVVRGGGDLATGVVARLHRAGFPVVVCELAAPLTVRRSVAVSTAVTEGSITVEGVTAALAADAADAERLARTGTVGVVVSPGLPELHPTVVVDARLAKSALDTSLGDAPLVIGLGPGFTAGADCTAVVETQRGARLGRVLWEGSAAPNTGDPGEVGGRGRERVLRAPTGGEVRWSVSIGSIVTPGVIGTVADEPVVAPFAGLVRGLIAEGNTVPAGLKIGDIDPRADVSVREISDKALAIGGGVLEAVLTWLNAC
jgi:xanthine dehydrogenase accessory factor